MAKTHHAKRWQSDSLAPQLPPRLARWSTSARRKILSDLDPEEPEVETLESDLDIDWEIDELTDWLDEQDYNADPMSSCSCSYEEQSHCASKTCPNSRDWEDNFTDAYDY